MAPRWRIFLGAIPAHPKNVKHIVKSGVVLHNFLTEVDSKYAYAGYRDCYQSNGSIALGQWRNEVSVSEKASCCFTDLSSKSGQNSTRKAKDVTNLFMNYFNEAGRVPWQFGLYNETETSESTDMGQ